MSGMPGLGRALASVTRRRFLLGAGAVAGAGAAAAAGAGIDGALDSGGHAASASAARSAAPVPLGTQPAGLPARQHAWTAVLARDKYGNPVPPMFSRLLFFDVNGTPSADHARVLEAALRTLERAYPWAPDGLLFTAGWGQPYFASVLRVASPIPVATALSDFELPVIDDYHLVLHLAGDDESRLAAVEAALVRGTPLPGADGPLDVSSALRWRETRTGFIGAGLPAKNQDTGGIPAGDPVPASAPLFMGFKSSLTRNQATEDDITISDGLFADGTTMHVSYMRLTLDDWYGQLSTPQRVARMYAPQVTPEEVADDFTTDAESDPNLLGQAISRYGVIGHAQTSARARRNGRPIILRRDFNTTDGGLAGLHFVALQRTIADFVTTRSAMNATSAQLQNPSITDTVNNGINEFIFVLKRGNYVLPTRAERSFPLLPGRQQALA
jgi:hypothetical protein